jgi:hypothetical protein
LKYFILGEAQMLKTICERQERELKQRDSSSKSDGVRLTRQEEQINKQRIEQHKLGEGNAVMSYLINSLHNFLSRVTECCRVSVQGVESLWGDCRFIPADWGHSS